jgi:hypothetical protein
MPTLAELQAQLTELNNAISAILQGGQEYRFNEGQIESLVKRGDLSTLYKMKKETLIAIEDLTDEGGGFFGF